MPSISNTFTRTLPITAKLNFLDKENLKFLAVGATLTRFAVAGMRVEENRPVRLKTNEMTPVEKQKAYAERCFMEFFGTAAYVFILHLGQDIAARILESTNKNLLKKTKAAALEELRQGKYNLDPEKFSQAYDKAMGTDMKGMIAKVLYGEKINGKYVRTTRKTLCQELDVPVERMRHYVPEAVRLQGKKLNILSSIAVMFGVIASAALGGYGIQWLNDNPFSVFLRRRYPENTPEGFLTLPANSTQFGTGNPFAQTTFAATRQGDK